MLWLYRVTAVLLLCCFTEYKSRRVCRRQKPKKAKPVWQQNRLYFCFTALLSTSLYCCVQGMKEAEKPKDVAKPVVAAKPADDKPVAKKIDLTDE